MHGSGILNLISFIDTISGMQQNVCASVMEVVMHSIPLALRKKLNKLAKLKGCETVGEWTRSIINHLYWCAISTEDGNGEVMLEKWISLVNHVHNKHRGHGKQYKKCAHGRLRNRKWFKHRKFNYINGYFFIRYTLQIQNLVRSLLI